MSYLISQINETLRKKREARLVRATEDERRKREHELALRDLRIAVRQIACEVDGAFLFARDCQPLSVRVRSAVESPEVVATVWHGSTRIGDVFVQEDAEAERFRIVAGVSLDHGLAFEVDGQGVPSNMPREFVAAFAGWLSEILDPEPE